MTVAAQQCADYIERRYPGVRIGRLACRLTTYGTITQHSAYAHSTSTPRHSNGLDIRGPEAFDYDDEVAFVDRVIKDIEAHRTEWSVRLLLWQVRFHYGHGHLDFYPEIIAPTKWCENQNVTPAWRFSNLHTIMTRDPLPENGLYDGPEASMAVWEDWVAGWVEGQAEDPAHFHRYLTELKANDAFNGNVDVWVAKLSNPRDPEWLGFYSRTDIAVWAVSTEG